MDPIRQRAGVALTMSALPMPIQRPSLCIFCNERKANTREHPWPKWLLECLRGQQPGRTTAWLGKERAPQSFGGELRIKCVCRPCNEGWLSDLENRVKQLLIPLLRDFKWPLSTDDQALI